jgi:hypothetical protein
MRVGQTLAGLLNATLVSATVSFALYFLLASVFRETRERLSNAYQVKYWRPGAYTTSVELIVAVGYN